MSKDLDLSVYLVTDTVQCGALGVAETVRQAVQAGATLVQVRDPDADDDAFLAMARDVVETVRGTGVPVLLDDRVHLVAAAGADGAHVGQSDMPVAQARAILGPDPILGLSVETGEQLDWAVAHLGRGDIDYLGLGPVRPTASKPNHAPATGLRYLSGLAARSPWPCVAIGGVKAADTAAVRRSGFAGVSVISAICGQPDVRAATRELVNAWASGGLPPVALTIAGSDPSGGAGIQADLKTFSALGAFGTSVITALTAQNTQGVTGVHVVPVDFVAQQFETLVADVRIDSIKVGMLATAELADEVAELLGELDAPVVLDPVMVATSGDRLLDDDAVQAVRRLIAKADIITPNLPEAAVLLGETQATGLDEMSAQAVKLRELGADWVLLKGGHRLDARATDVLAGPDGVHELVSHVVQTKNTHGTGCTLSSALAALRPRNLDWPSTAAAAKEWITGALDHADELGVGHGHGPVHHFYRFWS
ncbi:MAG: bifunctional hydroxymethylpyrimidine kinase/phosphomethylpyrimidine kinase [Propionibacterium sp.]|jgi:hydroxymethylpyrimidine kinase/phosphomethylpyrimidine kinase/thiamine-phosphate diphosphorylase|nr:bifunctional hydroxymethylpyrimidine kinase/phosphomethylpyrimidine kinase [Propionibacterium sp.]NLI84252.1 bifunctional hydroxymethylpyrimidine kinase/phosphomethylpyrimidine kinase [Propionibacterium sp.]